MGDELLRLALPGEVGEQRLGRALGADLGLDQREQRGLRAEIGDLAGGARALVALDQLGGARRALEAALPDHQALGERAARGVAALGHRRGRRLGRGRLGGSTFFAARPRRRAGGAPRLPGAAKPGRPAA